MRKPNRRSRNPAARESVRSLMPRTMIKCSARGTAVFFTMLNDPLCQAFADPRQIFQLFCGRGVDVDSESIGDSLRIADRSPWRLDTNVLARRKGIVGISQPMQRGELFASSISLARAISKFRRDENVYRLRLEFPS